ncbi:hypothetical protein [Flavobacterium sp. KACC 22763]|uniref:hypothetical protein n=1 Tax=Flavobacterium sp. KACC 22763 TaxID=3025668 RepID=UPI0023673E01|nr:hypothetical protein [Flavobacterium sp. KACC 22763]WDF65661.1 hypothetical protein PQ463_05710 [Flavobacterium sp. KACC 22763]
MISYKERHQSRRRQKNIQSKKVLVNIDYLIINLEGQPFGDFSEDSDFKMHQYDYGTKIFQNRSDVYYKDEKIGQYLASPRSAIINENLAQFQFENHLFYTKTLNELKTILDKFCDETNNYFKAVNRLDICFDRCDKDHTYRDLYNNINRGRYLISGRPKNIQAYFETYKGTSLLNGFQIGKRTSEKLIRCYNKTLSLQLTEKPYINNYYKANDFVNENIWRFEYQLNASFFRGLQEHSKLNKEVTQAMTWNIFDKNMLLELTQIANRGFFELKENTGKSQINKEKTIEFFDFKKIQNEVCKYAPIVNKKPKIDLSTTTIKKRLAKSLFREYYSNNQEVSYIVALNLLLEDNDLTTDKKLLTWFNNKFRFYLHEFRNKEKIKNDFDFKLFEEQQLLFL